MIWLPIYLLVPAFIVSVLGILLHPSHRIPCYINRALSQTHLPISHSLHLSKGTFHTMAHQIHQTLPSSLTATQYVLSTPELVSEILQWDAVGYKTQALNQTCRKRLASYARVNILWFNLAMRFLWWNPLPYSKLQKLEQLPRERKQVYANFMVDLALWNNPHFSYRENRILERLEFPRLRFAWIRIRPGQRLLSLPDIRSNVLQDLTIEVGPLEGRTWRGGALSDDKMQKRLAKRLMKMFPGLKKITLVLSAGEISPGDWERFQANFSGIRFVTRPKNSEEITRK